jgi:hypothetical protein
MRSLCPFFMIAASPTNAAAHLHSHKLGHLAIRRLDGRHCEQVPEWSAVLTVVQQPAADWLACPDGIAQLGHFLWVCALALQETAAAAAAAVAAAAGSVESCL